MNKPVRLEYQKLLLPLLVEQIFMMLIGNVNVFLLSMYTDTAVAATGLADQVLSIGTMTMGIVSLGSTVLFLQNADDEHLGYIRGAVRQAIILNVLVAAMLVLIFMFFGSGIMSLMQTPAELHPMAVLYLRIVGFSLLFQGLSTSASAVLRSFGQVRIAMQISIANTLITIIGNALVILGPGNFLGGGVLGISIATVIARLIGVGLSFWAIRIYLPAIWVSLLEYSRKDWQIGKKILALGIPSGMENVSFNFSQTIITGVIASLGAVSVTSKIYTQTITAIVFTISVAAGQAGQIMIGRYIRKSKLDKARLFAGQNTLLFILIGVTLNILIALSGPFIIRLFTTDTEIVKMVETLLWFNVLYDPLRMTNEILIASLQVTGDVRYPVMIGMLVTYGFTVPASILLGSIWQLGIYAVWLVFILDEGTRAYIFWRRWQKGEWQNFNLMHKGE